MRTPPSPGKGQPHPPSHLVKTNSHPSVHPGGNQGANLKSISHRYHPILVAFVCELTEEPINFPLGCLQGGVQTKYGQACGGVPRRARIQGS